MKYVIMAIAAICVGVLGVSMLNPEFRSKAASVTGAVNNEAKQTVTKTNSNGFVYKSDKREYAQRPNDDTASREGWTQEDDIMILVEPNSSSVAPFYIDAFEATISDHRAWSVSGQYPTDKIKFDNAATACEAAGKRLCYTHEWQAACRGGYTQPVAFQLTDMMWNNCYFAKGKPYTETDRVETTDSHIECTPSGLPLFHMVGNLAEFTQSTSGQQTVVGLTYYDVHLKDKMGALKQACEAVPFPAGSYPRTKYNKGIGFRCCMPAQ
ncbi:MAG TPA: hypothetical protein EYQ41_07120 [Micavibrio sp.]|nr:hypothetical protein [Micavibrio sp.]